MLYSLLRPLLFRLPPEFAHDLSIYLLSKWNFIFPTTSGGEATCNHMGLDFKNPIGLAAGLDKNARCLKAWGKMGFGFAEVGTVTPKPQAGNPKPRLFRLTKDRAIINRMGFNGSGLDSFIENLKSYTPKYPLGVNIGKNKITPNESAIDDYSICLEKVYAFADYITINISSPNTPNLRDLQESSALDILLSKLNNKRKILQDEHSKHVPLVIKISPDLSLDEVKSILDVCIKNNIQGIIATNTTSNNRELLTNKKYRAEVGGLSGAPVFDSSTKVLHILKQHTGDSITLIGVGGILNPADANQKFAVGADLVQIYTGLIYQGPKLVQNLVKEFRKI
jgi:dihydroorotate dehydrogenase